MKLRGFTDVLYMQEFLKSILLWSHKSTINQPQRSEKSDLKVAFIDPLILNDVQSRNICLFIIFV